MKNSLFVLLLLLTGCLEILSYSERTYVHTIGVLPGKPRYCAFEINETGPFDYSLSSPLKIDFLIIDRLELNKNISLPEVKAITKGHLMMNYSERIELGPGEYLFIIFNSQGYTEVIIRANKEMDCYGIGDTEYP